MVPFQPILKRMVKFNWNTVAGRDGFSYLSLMALIVIIGISLTGVAYQWKTVAKREKEKELLFRGNEFRFAITQYKNLNPLKRYPHSVEDLIKDPNSPDSKRYLRKLYKDPITGGEFVPIFDPAKGLIGVRSGSTEKPLKTSHFKVIDRCFEDKQQYREWLFIVEMPLVVQAIARPITTPGSESANTGAVPLLAPPCPTIGSITDEPK